MNAIVASQLDTQENVEVHWKQKGKRWVRGDVKNAKQRGQRWMERDETLMWGESQESLRCCYMSHWGAEGEERQRGKSLWVKERKNLFSGRGIGKWALQGHFLFILNSKHSVNLSAAHTQTQNNYRGFLQEQKHESCQQQLKVGDASKGRLLTIRLHEFHPFSQPHNSDAIILRHGP